MCELWNDFKKHHRKFLQESQLDFENIKKILKNIERT